MKLYATTTSERASKGQGGKWLEIDILGEDKQKLLNIKAREHADGEFYVLELSRDGGKKLTDFSEMFITKQKGKSQKGENNTVEWYKKNTNKSPDCPHYINSDKHNPDGWKFCTQC